MRSSKCNVQACYLFRLCALRLVNQSNGSPQVDRTVCSTNLSNADDSRNVMSCVKYWERQVHRSYAQTGRPITLARGLKELKLPGLAAATLGI